MPYALIIPLQADSHIQLPNNSSRALHANFHDWLRRADEELAIYIHDRANPKPFTLSALRSYGEECLAWRITLLQDDLWPLLEAGLRQAPQVDIVGQSLPVVEDELQVEGRSYQSLADEAATDTRLAIRFNSPTSFRMGDLHSPLPEPYSVFRSWLSRWNAFAPEGLRLNINTLDVVAVHVAISRYRLRTEVADFGRSKLIGFVGTVHYRVLRANMLPDEVVKRLNILADYSHFCGTGHKTTQGMGQTRRVPHRA